MLAIDGARRREVFRMIEAPHRDIDSARLLVTLPAQRGPASAAEFPHHAGRRSELSGLPARVLELVGRDEEPGDRLRACRTPAVRAVTDQHLVGRAEASIANLSAQAAADELASLRRFRHTRHGYVAARRSAAVNACHGSVYAIAARTVTLKQ